ncbi:MAG: hypothetical protein ICV53_17310, partial [Flavisolibacter sp.]|nr:hypothetical protein [Flavisolibacter sp.]
YNEYVDGRKLPAEFQNYQAATDLVQWLLQQSKNVKQQGKNANLISKK